MVRLTWILGVCAMLICGSSLVAMAGRIMVNVDAKGTTDLVDVNIKDADVSQVLTTLFNSTSGKYQVRFGAGVVGVIDDLEFSQKPFDEAVSEILNKVNPDFTMMKQGNSLYRISSNETSGVATPEPSKGILAPPKNQIEDIIVIPAKLPPIDYTMQGGMFGGMNGGGGGMMPGMGTPGASATGEKPAPEECLLAMITIQNIPVTQLALAFGFESIPAFDEDDDDDNYNDDDDNYYDDDDDNYNDDDDDNYDSRSSRRNRNDRNDRNNRNYYD